MGKLVDYCSLEDTSNAGQNYSSISKVRIDRRVEDAEMDIINELEADTLEHAVNTKVESSSAIVDNVEVPDEAEILDETQKHSIGETEIIDQSKKRPADDPRASSRVKQKTTEVETDPQSAAELSELNEYLPLELQFISRNEGDDMNQFQSRFAAQILSHVTKRNKGKRYSRGFNLIEERPRN